MRVSATAAVYPKESTITATWCRHRTEWGLAATSPIHSAESTGPPGTPLSLAISRISFGFSMRYERTAFTFHELPFPHAKLHLEPQETGCFRSADKSHARRNAGWPLLRQGAASLPVLRRKRFLKKGSRRHRGGDSRQKDLNPQVPGRGSVRFLQGGVGPWGVGRSTLAAGAVTLGNLRINGGRGTHLPRAGPLAGTMRLARQRGAAPRPARVASCFGRPRWGRAAPP